MKKICFVTAARSEYGLIKWIMKEVEKSSMFQLQLIVTGAHLLPEQGHTIDAIIDDGFVIDEIIDIHLKLSSKTDIAESMGRIAEGFSRAFEKLSPDCVVVLGDRYELLPIVNTAFVMTIPIVHISGGDVTEGAIDDGIRNAVTMLADYHFPGTPESANNIIRMRGSRDKVWAVGEPGLDVLYKESLISRDELAENLGLDSEKKWVLLTYHPETRKKLNENLSVVKTCVELLLDIDGIQVVATYSNVDYGGDKINLLLEEVSRKEKSILKVVPSLGNKRYLSFMRQVAFVIGNSSSGIIETPMLGIPSINIGERQKGRHICKNVIQTSDSRADIEDAIKTALSLDKFEEDYYWGDGHASERIIKALSEAL